MQAANGQGLPFHLSLSLYFYPSRSINQTMMHKPRISYLQLELLYFKNELKTAQCQQKIKTRIK